jgi:hypothetical protein
MFDYLNDLINRTSSVPISSDNRRPGPAVSLLYSPFYLFMSITVEVFMKSAVFFDVGWCSLLEIYLRFVGAC